MGLKCTDCKNGWGKNDEAFFRKNKIRIWSYWRTSTRVALNFGGAKIEFMDDLGKWILHELYLRKSISYHKEVLVRLFQEHR